MTDSQTSLTTPDTAQQPAPQLSLEQELELLLDELGVDFVMHTHHPLAHLEYGAQTTLPGDGEFNVRNECGDPPTMGGTLSTAPLSGL
jgi:hypothetical protein